MVTEQKEQAYSLDCKLLRMVILSDCMLQATIFILKVKSGFLLLI
jgi:hypothetical protein